MYVIIHHYIFQVVQRQIPPSKFADIVKSAITIQRAFRKYKQKKLENDLPDLQSEDVKNATVKIQSAYRGFKTRKDMKQANEDLPDLEAADVAAAALKIQSAYKGFKTRKMVKTHKEMLPDLNCAQVADATIKIQSAYRGFKSRKGLKKRQDSLPDLKAKDVVDATIKIQSAYRGFKTRKDVTKKEEELPDLCDPETVAAALKIQSSFKGYQARKAHSKVPLTPQPSIDFENMAPTDFSKAPTKRVPPVPKRADTKEMQSQKSTSKPVPKSPLPARSSKLKEVAIPSIPPKSKQARQRVASSSSSTFSEAERETASPVTPTTPSQDKGRRSTGDSSRARSKSREKPKKDSAQKEADDAAKSKIGGFFSSMFKSKPKQKPTTPTEILSPEMKTVSNVESKFDEKLSREKQILKTPATEVKSPKTETSKKVSSSPSAQSIKTDDANGQPKQPASQEQDIDDPDLKKDLIHTVLNAVQENWLNQAPKPTLDKVAALQVPDSDPELENSERSTSEADYMKKKMKAQKKEDIHSDDEGAQLWKQESADGDLPYVETTLPQEKPGTVSITPAAMRITQTSLTSTERPRTSGPRRPGTLSQFVKTKDEAGKEPLTVKLPRQESKSKLKGKVTTTQQSWDNFSAAGLKRVPPKSIAIKKAEDQGKTWVDCESLPEKKKQAKKCGVSEPVKSPASDTSRSGLQTPTGTQIVSPEECSCDCHQQSPTHSHSSHSHSSHLKIAPHKPKEPVKTSKGPQRVQRESSNVTKAASSRAGARKEPTPPVGRKMEAAAVTKGAGLKTTAKRPGGPPTPPIRTTSVSKSTKVRYEDVNNFNGHSSTNSLVFCSRDPGVKTEKPKVSSTPSTSRPAVTSSSRAPPRPRPGPSQEQSDNIVRRTPGASGAVRRRPEEPRRSTLAKRSSTVSSVR